MRGIYARALDVRVDPALHSGALVVKLAEFERKADGLGNDGDIREEVVHEERLEAPLDGGAAGAELRCHFGGQGLAGGRDGERDCVLEGAEGRGWGRGEDVIEQALQTPQREGTVRLHGWPWTESRRAGRVAVGLSWGAASRHADCRIKRHARLITGSNPSPV